MSINFNYSLLFLKNKFKKVQANQFAKSFIEYFKIERGWQLSLITS